MRTCWRHRPATRLRPLTPHDGATVDVVFAGLSARSRVLRFHRELQQLTASTRDALLATDGVHHVGIVAEVRGGRSWEPVGLGRYVVEPSGTDAEVAFEVVDAWQGRGIGRLLLTELVVTARRHRVPVFRAHVLPDNHASLRLLRHVLPDQRVRRADGALEIVAQLEPRPLSLTDLLDDLGAISANA